MLLAELDWWV